MMTDGNVLKGVKQGLKGDEKALRGGGVVFKGSR